MTALVPLPRKLFAASADIVAPRLLGHWLIRQTPGGPVGGPIVEVEAYLRDDPASHAFRGSSARNQSMFGEPGRAYVYLIYGVHHCVNAVCQRAGVGEAVLIRALAPEFGVETMCAARSVPDPRNLTNGPGKLCAALDIGRRLDGVDLCAPDSPLVIAQNPKAAEFIRAHGPVAVGPRIGITQAAILPLRFRLAGSAFVSRQQGR